MVIESVAWFPAASRTLSMTEYTPGVVKVIEGFAPENVRGVASIPSLSVQV